MLVSIGTGRSAGSGGGHSHGGAYGPVYASVGVHPHDARGHGGDWTAMRDLAAHPKVLILGEMGLDFHYDHSPREVQRALSADSWRLRRNWACPSQFIPGKHGGSCRLPARSLAGVGNGGISIAFRWFGRGGGGAVARLLSRHRWRADLPQGRGTEGSCSGHSIESITFRTDAPYLARPVQGKRNEPAFLVHTARKLAEVKSS